MMSVTAAQRIVLLGGRTGSRRTQDRPGENVMDAQNVGFRLWLGIAVVALIWACVQIWHARRALNGVQHDISVQQGRSASSAVAELTSSVIAQ